MQQREKKKIGFWILRVSARRALRLRGKLDSSLRLTQRVTPCFSWFVSPERALKDAEIGALSRQPVFRGIFLLAWGLHAQNTSGFVLPSRGKEMGGGEPWRPPSSSTWHASRFCSKSPSLGMVFGRRTFSRLKDRGPTGNPFFTELAASSSSALPPVLCFFCLLDGHELLGVAELSLGNEN